MKILEQPDGLEGYVVHVEEDDFKGPLDLPELKCAWKDILWEGVIKKGGFYHAVYLTNNEFALEFLIPDAEWLDADLRAKLEAALI